jgi:NAD(P)-dependent dehydrogenase (short-subunit alcohol dehydrogenase family)
MRLKDKVILITGSTTGIGEATARRFVAEGARVILHGMERDLGEKILADLGASAFLHCNDLGQPNAARELIDASVKHFGRLDGIVNNAATTRRATLEETDPAMFDFVININLRAPLLLIRAALPYLKAARGSVLNVGSVNAYSGASNLVPYSISKGGLMTLTRNLADSLCTEQVRVNQINPGWVLTPNESKMMTDAGNPPNWWKNPPRHAAPSGSLISPETIAAAAVYWIGDESRPISGAVVDMTQFPIIGRNVVIEK